MKTSTLQQHQRRLMRVIDYMYQHVNEELDVNTLADFACMSPYHFHRIYRTFVGEPVYQSVKRMRLLNAAATLIHSDSTIATIAQDARYGSVEAFNRAFQRYYGESPGAFRQHRTALSINAAAFYPKPKDKDLTMFTVEMVESAPIKLLGLPHEGDYLKIGNAFEKVALLAQTADLLDDNTRWFGVYYHDPQTVTDDELRSFAGISVPEDTAVPEGLEVMLIPASKAATLLHKGDYSELEKPYNWLFGDWLPESGLTLVDFPPFEEYLNDQKTTPPSELLTRINCLVA